jgi:hypothetical protein
MTYSVNSVEEAKLAGYLIEPLLEDETRQRWYRATYYQLAAQQRSGPVGFHLIPQMRQLLKGHLNKPDIAAADEHLQNAGNEDLPLFAREQHFDIAGAKVWNYFISVKGNDSILTDYMHLHMKGHGV